MPVESITSGIHPVGKTGVQYVEIVKIVRSVDRYTSSGGWNTRIVEHRFRITVLSEKNIEKCSAEVSIWAGGSWKFIHRVPPRDMSTSDSLREIYDETKNPLLPENFEADRNELVRVASEICFE